MNFSKKVLEIMVILLLIAIFIILNTTYEMCLVVEDTEVCTYQKIGDYLLGKENVEEIVKK